MVFGHVLMHIRVVLSDVALRAAVGNGPESEWRGIGVWTLELQGWEDKTNKLKTNFNRLKKKRKYDKNFFIVWFENR